MVRVPATDGKSTLPTGRHSVQSACGACGAVFCGVEAFDAHRVGPIGEEFAPGRYRQHAGRHCMAASDLDKKFRRCELDRLVLK